MNVSLFKLLIFASAALSSAAAAKDRYDHSVLAVNSARGYSTPAELFFKRDTSDAQELLDLKDEQDLKNFENVQAQEVDESRRRYWKPTDAPWQIILSKVVIPSNDTTVIEPSFASIIEVDLFDTPVATFRALKKAGKKVICYFSAGTSEDWREDYKDFKPADKGACLPAWAGERYLDIRSPNVWKIMRNRIRLGKRKGCDAIDPDNVDVTSNNNGKNLTAADAITFIKKLAAEAHRRRMAFGLKNAQNLLPNVTSVTDFAVNEECAKEEEGAEGCASYGNFTALGRPVFHIEYTNYTTNPETQDLTLCTSQPALSNLTSRDVRDRLCLAGYENTIGKRFSTVIKNLGLDDWVLYCDGRWAKTNVNVKAAAIKARFECPVVSLPGADLQLPAPQGEGLCKVSGGNSSEKVLGRRYHHRRLAF